MQRAIEIPTDEEIEAYSKKFDNEMTSMTEGIWVPQGVIYGAKWMRDKLKDHLQRKVKKCPRVDGLPEMRNGYTTSQYLLIWLDEVKDPFLGYYSENTFWYEDSSPVNRYTTDEILFYADPEEII